MSLGLDIDENVLVGVTAPGCLSSESLLDGTSGIPSAVGRVEQGL